MRLLLTRPMADAMVVAEQLAGQGHDVLLSPLIDISLDREAVLPPLDAQRALAFTSANGVRALMAQLQAGNLASADRAAWRNLPVFAVGPQTAAAAQAAGFAKIRQAGGDVAALAAMIGRHKDEAAPVLHIAGRDRAGDLAALLDEKAVAASRAVLYRADAANAFSDAAAAALRDAAEPVDGVLLYSQRSAVIFLSLYETLSPHQAPRPTAFCLSPPIADAMRAAGFQAMAPRRAESEALLALLAV